MDRYIGLDVHATSTTLAVVGPSGRRLRTSVVETNGKALIEVLKTIPEPRHVCLEEGTQAEWLFQILKPHATEVVVAKVASSRGQKSDAKDAFGLAELLRTGNIGARVFKDVGAFATLRDLSRLYTMLRDDVVRTKNRIKSLYRSRGVATPDGDVYAAKHRAKWLKTLTPGKRMVAEKLYDELDKQSELKDAAEEALVEESHRHPVAKVLETCPGFGPIRAAQMMAIVVAPHRFRTKRQFWAYCGLGIVTRSSSDWVQGTRKGEWLRAPVQLTRGLNINHNHLAKAILKGAATTVIATRASELAADYQRLLMNGTKPNLAKLTIARRIAAILLAVWKTGEEYDPNKHRKQKLSLAS